MCGEARPVGEPTESPLSGKAVLATWYQVREWSRSADGRHRSRSTHHTGKVNRSGSLRYEGFRLVPWHVESQGGAVRLRGLPDLTFRQPKAMTVGADFRPDRAEHEERTERPGIPRFASRARVQAGPRDHCHLDWKHGDLVNPSEMNRFEYRLEPGEVVCACGVQDGNSLVPSPARPKGLPVYTGLPETVIRDLQESAKIWKILGGTCLVGVVAVVVGSLTML